MIVTILEIIAIIIAIMLVSGIIYMISNGCIFNWFYHDVLEWHLPDDEPQKFDGCNIHTHCKFCGKEIMQDSQGNWF